MGEEGEGEGEGVLPEEEGGEEEEADVVLFREPGAESVRFLVPGESVPVEGPIESEEEEEGAKEEEEEEVEGAVVVEGVVEVGGESCSVGTGNSDSESVFGKASVFHAGGIKNDGEQAEGEGGGEGGREGGGGGVEAVVRRRGRGRTDATAAGTAAAAAALGRGRLLLPEVTHGWAFIEHPPA